MRIATTVPTLEPRDAGRLFASLEAAGYDDAFTFEASHDPFLPLALAAEHTSRVRLGTAVAIGFARNPMVLANIGHDLQRLSEGRFVLGLGSQIKPHIEKRFSETWSHPSARMRELVLAIKAIWDAWDGDGSLRFEGEFYRHTLMTPVFNPGPHPFGRPPVHVGGFGPKMLEITGEVADGLIVHPFNSRRSMTERVLPALARGRERAGRAEDEVEVTWVTMVAAWDDPADRDDALLSARGQLAFYGSTPAYAPVLDLHGFGDLHAPLNKLSKEGRWLDMAALIPDELLEEIIVCGPRDEIADRLLARTAGGLATTLSLVNNRNPDSANFADIVGELRRRGI